MITIILPISRRDYLRPVFNCLSELERPDDTELLIVLDGDEYLERAVYRRLESVDYRRIQVMQFGDTPGEDIDSRRYRIAAIHNKAKIFVSDYSDYVFLVEDDTVYPADALSKMLITLQSPLNGYVEGVQLGRRNAPYVGAWVCDDISDPKFITSIVPSKRKDRQSSIDAGGLYCCLVISSLYKSHTFKPLDKKGTNGLSCDVNFGLAIRKQGYNCLIDWSIQCDHIGDNGSVNLGNTKPLKVIFEKLSNRWSAHAEV